MKSYTELELLITRWAEARQIYPNSSPVAQARKTLEEAGELLEAAAKLEALKKAGLEGSPQYRQAFDEYADAVGDVTVTLVIGCLLADIPLTECLSRAWSEIKDRKGTLSTTGIFVKEAA